MKNLHSPRAGVPMDETRARGIDLILGAAAGAVGVWVMDQVGWLMLRSENTATLTRDLQARPGTAAETARIAAQVHAVRTGKDNTATALGKATQVSGVSPTNQQPGPGSALFHYALGMLPGALYGVTRRIQPSVGTGHGVLYGVALFVVMDETAAPLTGIASGPGRYPWQAHMRGLVAHLVLGVTTEVLLRATERFR